MGKKWGQTHKSEKGVAGFFGVGAGFGLPFCLPAAGRASDKKETARQSRAASVGGARMSVIAPSYLAMDRCLSRERDVRASDGGGDKTGFAYILANVLPLRPAQSSAVRGS